MDYLKYTPELANDWKNALSMTESWASENRVTVSMNQSQLESKLWIVNELSNLMLFPKSVALLGGWYANFIVPLLIDHGVEFINNFEIDENAKDITYKFNKRYKDEGKYRCDVVDVIFKPIYKRQEKLQKPFDTIINTSCEHMFPMRRFKTLNKNELDDCLYILQSTSEDKYEDHINCVSSPEELAEQAEILDIIYTGVKKLPNGMERFMVIGK